MRVRFLKGKWWLLLAWFGFGVAQAQSEGDGFLNFGWGRWTPKSVKNNEMAPEKGSLFLISLGYFNSDHLSTELMINLPKKINFKGQVIGRSSDGNAVISDFAFQKVPAFNPALIAKYHLFDSETPLRPFIGAGVIYYNLNNKGVASLSNGWMLPDTDFETSPVETPPGKNLPPPLTGSRNQPQQNWVSVAEKKAVLADDKTVHFKKKAGLSLTAGVDYQMDGDMFVNVAFFYNPVTLKATVQLREDVSESKPFSKTFDIKANTTMLMVGVGYRFGT